MIGILIAFIIIGLFFIPIIRYIGRCHANPEHYKETPIIEKISIVMLFVFGSIGYIKIILNFGKYIGSLFNNLGYGVSEAISWGISSAVFIVTIGLVGIYYSDIHTAREKIKNSKIAEETLKTQENKWENKILFIDKSD